MVISRLSTDRAYDSASAEASAEAVLLPLTPATYHILLVLADGKSHGYAMMQEIEQLTLGRIRIGAGTLYRSLQKLVLDGLIEELPVGLEEDEDERRRYYRLTRLGRRIAKAEAQRLADLVELSRRRGLLPPERKQR